MFYIEIIRNTIRNLINPFKFQNILLEVINHGKCYQPLIVISLQSSKYYNNYSKKVFGYCYHLLDVIRFGLAQSDHIKRYPLYITIHKAK